MYCMYLRKSRADLEAEARGEGETLARHENLLWDLAKRLKIHISKVHREVVSGETIASRPVMQQLLSDVEQGMWKGVLVVEVERLARGDTMDQGLVAQTFLYSNTKIITPLKIYDPNNEFDEEYFEFGLFMSRREYKTTNRRLKTGRLASAKEGKYTGNKPPYGYVRKKIVGQKGFTLEPHPDQAPVVKRIFHLYTNGCGVSIICRKLNELKIASATGGVWVVASVRGILSNPVYTGKIRQGFRPQIKKMVGGEIVKERPRAKNYNLYQGLHPAIVSQEDFDLAQELLANNPSTPAPKDREIKNPLAGLVICGKCGRKLIRRPYSDGSPDCLMCPIPACDNISAHLSLVEDKLLQGLTLWLENYKIKFTAEEEYEDIETLRKAIEKTSKEKEILEKQKSNLHDLLEQKIYTNETYLERSNNLNMRIEAADNHKKQLEDRIIKASDRAKAKIEIIPRVEEIISIYREMETAEGKNKLLKEVLEKVVYVKEVDARFKQNNPDDFKLTIIPRLSKHFDN
jgi:site-specific DNA recombinase